ncbi:MAG: hypothetical protein HQL77_01050 [Magnetococcales bacterium]|nr:hypothetical protein [Magnetococcales bacterium]
MTYGPRLKFSIPRWGGAQQGAALLIIMAVILLGGISLALDALLIKSKRMHGDQVSNLTLARAKKALIAYAAMQAGIPPLAAKLYGKLPCPYEGFFRNSDPNDVAGDYSNNATEGPCTINSGFLPWRTLGLPPLVDGEMAPIWYAVSPRFMTGDTVKGDFLCNQADLTIVGDTTAYAAIVFAPGQTLPLIAPKSDQTRPSDIIAANLLQEFLEEGNADGDTTYEIRNIKTDRSGGLADPPFNDRLLGITCAEILNALTRL